MKVYLGLDTSCYTASLAAVNEAGQVIFDGRMPLAVPPGQRGLRQSEALFQHLRQLGALAERWRATLPGQVLALAAASTRPRPVAGSYLPVFLAGATVGQAMAAGADVPFFGTSHQEGHLRAALYGADNPPVEFLAVHLSGGTSEALRAAYTPSGFALELLGGTEDLHAGQFIDRLGVAMGLPFPAGAAFEELAKDGRPEAIRLPVAVRGLRFSLSGPLSAAERALRSGIGRADLAAAALDCLAESIGSLLKAAISQTGLADIVLGGGVCANQRLREGLVRYLPHARLIFARPELATDNAVGVALLGRDYQQN